MDVLPLLTELNSGLPAERQATLKQQLAQYLNHLLLHDFPALVQLLYRVDVPEKKLKAVLADHAGEDAGVLMADLMIERQQQKMEARKNFRVKERYDDGEERW
jgi:hypothetical protein